MKEKVKYIVFLFLRTILIMTIFLSLYAITRIFLADRFKIPTESMLPALIPGDDILVDKTLIGARIYTDYDFNKDGGTLHSIRLHGLRNIKINDIIVSNKYKYHDGIKFVLNDLICKRCVGLPGDSVCIKDGFYQNNNYKGIIGNRMSQALLSSQDINHVGNPNYRTFPKKRQIPWTIKNFGPYYVPRQGDVIRLDARNATIYKVQLEWELGKSVSVNWELNEVYAGGKRIRHHRFLHNYYFLAGDNVLSSDDSRYRGPVPEEYIIGIATRILYSKDEKKGKCRWKRFWEKI